MRGLRSSVLLLASLVSLAGCAAPSGGQRLQSGAGAESVPPPNRQLVAVIRFEPVGMANKLLIGLGNTRFARRIVGANLAIRDERGEPRAYMAESLPTLNSSTWQVFPDGRMETTYVLRQGLTWHDGTPLSSEDFLFAYRVYTHPDTAHLWGANPQSMMEDVVAVDQRTLLVRWRQTYPEANALTDDFPPLPRHILDAQFQRDRGDAFVNHPYWSMEHVGLGAFKIERWEPGTFMELAAFDAHALGRARVDRLKLIWISDPNTVLANLLAGESHIALNDAMRFQQGTVLKREWAGSGGSVLVSAREVRFIQVQFSPQFTVPRSLLDVRVRRGLASSVDKQALVDGLLEGEGTIAQTMVSPEMPYFPTLLEAIAKYPFDPRRAEQLMAEAGYTRDAAGFYASPSGERFSPEFRAFAGAQEEAELAIIVDGLRRTGIDVPSQLIPAVHSRDVQIRASFPALTANVSQLAERTVLNKLQGYNIPTAENRWAGFNRGAWANPEFDRLDGLFNTTLDRTDRDRAMIQMMKLVSEEIPVIPLYYNLDAVAHVGALVGPVSASPEATRDWNVHEWHWRS